MKEEYIIKLKDDMTPFALTVPIKVTMPLYAEIKDEIDRMLKSRLTSSVEPNRMVCPYGSDSQLQWQNKSVCCLNKAQ